MWSVVSISPLLAPRFYTEDQTGVNRKKLAFHRGSKKNANDGYIWLRFPTLGGGFNCFFLNVIPKIGKMMQFDEHVFFRWLVSTNYRSIFGIYQKPATQQKSEGFLQRTHSLKKNWKKDSWVKLTCPFFSPLKPPIWSPIEQWQKSPVGWVIWGWNTTHLYTRVSMEI